MRITTRGLRRVAVSALLAIGVAIAVAANASAANTVAVPATASFWAAPGNGGTAPVPAGISVAGSATATISVDGGWESPFPGAQNYPNSAVFLMRWFDASHTAIALPPGYPNRAVDGPLGDGLGGTTLFNPLGNTLAGNSTGGFGTPGPYSASVPVPAGAATVEIAWYDSGYADNSGTVHVTVDPAPALPAGLVGWWKLDETSGSVAADSSGNGNSGAISNAALGQPGMVGTSFSFSGSSSSNVNIPTTPALRPSQITISTWVKPTSFACGQCGVVSNEPTGGVQYGYGLRLNAGGFANVQFCGDGGVGYGDCAYAPSNSAPLNQWTHIVATWNGSHQLRIWVNGSMVAESNGAPGTPYSTTQPLRIGGLPFGGLPYIGSIDDVKIFNRVLTPSEIAALASATPPPPADTTPPVITVPAAITGVEATGPAGAAVTYSASASDAVSGSVATTCVPPSGSTFPIGTTTVVCSASDAAGNAASASFTVAVVDSLPPALTVPASTTAEATSPAGAAVTYSGASAVDVVSGPVTPTCVLPSGSTFPLGVSTVVCVATDSRGNSSSGSFTVTVVDTTAPVVTVPAAITREATSAAGAAVTYAASASDSVSGAIAPACLPASGATFPLGTTTVSCSATDAAGNTGSAWFTVTVVDTTAPTVTASLVNTKKDGDESEQIARVVFAASDAVGVAGSTATLNGIAVTNGQVVKLKLKKKGAQKVEREDGKLQIEATSFLLTVVVRDAAGNVTTVTATPLFGKSGKDDGGDDHRGDSGKD